MLFIGNMIRYLLDTINNGDCQTTKDILLLAGLFYATKFSLKTVYKLYNTLKTFCLPMIWSHNFQEKYGSWAGMYNIHFIYILLKTNSDIFFNPFKQLHCILF